MRKAKTHKSAHWGLQGFVWLVLIVGAVTAYQAMVGGAAPRPTTPPAPRPPEHRVITKTEMDAVLASMNQYQGVRESRIVQEGKTFKLALLVSLGVTEAEARDLGDSFVRQVKGIIDDTQPTKTIGMGSFRYMVIVGTNGNKVLAQGEKWPESESINWE